MTQFQTAFYLGEEKETGYSGVIVENGLFLALEVSEGLTPEAGRELLKTVKSRFQESPPNSLSDIDNLLSNLIRENNVALGLSVSLGFLRGGVLYLKTVGHGEVIIRRRSKVAVLISGDTSASGYFENDDIFVFTTGTFIDLAGGREKFAEMFDHRDPHQIVEEITPQLQLKKDHGAVAAFLQFKDENDIAAENEYIKPRGFFMKIRDDIKGYYVKHGQRKTMTFAAVLLISLIFIWSVVLGYSRRTSAEATEKIRLARELVEQKITEAEEVSFLNTARASAIIAETKNTLADLKKKYPDRDDIKEIEMLVASSENKVFKKEEAQSEEFFDLAVDNQKAKGDRLSLDGDNLLILDKAAGTIYTLSLDKKSLSASTVPDTKKATLVANYEDKKYFFVPGSGVFSINDNDKAARVIPNDPDWGIIVDFTVYNGNLYLLDTGKSEIYKYLTAESGFGAKTSYFAEGQATNLSIYKSLSIDSSVYLGGGESVIKFTAGSRDGFAMNLPATQVGLTKVFTSRDLDRVYGWDKGQGMVYVMGKDGEFEKQVKSEILSKGQDIVVYGSEIFVLAGSKIYKIQ